MATEQKWDFPDLKALFINCTLKKSPAVSNTEGLLKISRHIMEKHGVKTELIGAVDHDIAPGVWPECEAGARFAYVNLEYRS
mgnify:CR=1 FL=1